MSSKGYGALCRYVLLPLGDLFARQCVMQGFEFMNRSQWWPRERLDALQAKRLQNTVQAAYNDTALYRRLMDERGILPHQIKKPSDLDRLPVLTKPMLRSHYPHACTRRTTWRTREYFTSGSTGEPFALRVDDYSMSIARALMLLRATFSGWEVGDPYLQTGMTLDRGLLKAAKDFIMRASYVSAFNLSDEVLDRYLDVIDARRIRYLMGYAASLFCLAQRAKSVRFNHTLSGIVSWGDNMFPHYRALLEEQFRCRVTDTYGCGEGIQVSAQCAEGRYHIFSPHVVVEFVRNGEPVAPGESGEILLTRLDPGATPLIRYSIGDLGRQDPAIECRCGRGLAIMAGIDGRSADIVTTPNGNRLIVHFFTGIFEYARSIKTFQVVQSRPDEITVKLVPRGQFDPDEWEYLKAEILTKGDADLRVTLEVVPDIALLPSHKRRFVVSLLGGDEMRGSMQ